MQHPLTVSTDYLIQFIFHYDIYIILKASIIIMLSLKFTNRIFVIILSDTSLYSYVTYFLPHDGVTALVQNGLLCHFLGHAFDGSIFSNQKEYINL